MLCSYCVIYCSQINFELEYNTKNSLGSWKSLLYPYKEYDLKIIHIDVKAPNVLLDDYCEAVIGDFKLAKLLDHHDSYVTIVVRGTVGYIFGILIDHSMESSGIWWSSNHKGTMLDWVCMSNPSNYSYVSYIFIGLLYSCYWIEVYEKLSIYIPR